MGPSVLSVLVWSVHRLLGCLRRNSTLGNFCIAGGGMSTSVGLDCMIENEATVVCCTPTYAMRMAEVAAQEGIDLKETSVRMLVVAGEPGGAIPATRARIEEAWEARVIDHSGIDRNRVTGC